MPVTEEDVLGLLRGVVDPELGGDVVDLGMIRSVAVGGDGRVAVEVALTTAGCPLKSQLDKDITTRVGGHPGISGVDITWGEMSDDERAACMDRARWHATQRAGTTMVPNTTRVLAIASGKGGVGKSSVTANLAVGLAVAGYAVGVLDADIGGFSQPRMLGLEGGLEADENKKIVPHRRRFGAGYVEAVSMGHLVDDEQSSLTWDGRTLNRAVRHFLEDVRWDEHLDYLLIDMPPGTGDIQIGLARMLPRAEMVLVTTPALAAQKVAARAADLARKTYLRIVGVVENMSAFVCEHGTSYALFGEGGGLTLATEIGAPLLGQIPLEPNVVRGGDRGEPAVLGEGPAADAFRALVRLLVDEAAPPVDMAACSARLLERVEAALGGTTS